MTPLRALVTWAISLWVAVPLTAQEWDRFRGPDGQGRAPAIPDLDLRPGSARWRAALPGTGHASPIVVEDLVITTAVSAETRERFVVAHDVASGERRWVHAESVEAHPQHRLNSFAASTPAADARGIYVAWTNGERLEVVGLDRAGRERWRRDVGPHRAQHGSGASPIAVAGVVVVANDHEAEGKPSAIVGLDAETGEERWRRERTTVRAAYSTPVTRRVGEGVEVLLTSSAHGITSLDPRTGALRWELPEVFRERCVGSLVFNAAGVAFASAGSGGGGKEACLVKLPRGDERDAPEVRTAPRRALPYVPTAIATEDHLFLWSDGGIVSCLALPAGDVLWSERVGGTFYGSPILLGDRLIAMNTDGELILLRAGKEFVELARHEFAEGSQATPAVARGLVFVRTLGTLYAFGGA